MSATSAGEQPISAANLTLNSSVLINGGDSGASETNGLASINALVVSPTFAHDSHATSEQPSPGAVVSTALGTDATPVTVIADQPDHFTTVTNASPSDLSTFAPVVAAPVGSQALFTPASSDLGSMAPSVIPVTTQTSSTTSFGGTDGLALSGLSMMLTASTLSNEFPTVGNDELLGSLMEGIWLGRSTDALGIASVTPSALLQWAMSGESEVVADSSDA
jgi:hypothetical protein